MVSSVHDESAWIVGMLFRVERVTNRFEPNGTLFWGNDLKFILMEKNTFQRYNSMSMFEVMYKKITFSRQSVELIVKSFASFFVKGQLGLRIKIRDYFWTRFDAMNPLVVSELTNELQLKITFFEVSPIVSMCIKFQ